MKRFLILAVLGIAIMGCEQQILDINTEIKGTDCITTFYLNGEYAGEKHNRTTDTLLNEMLSTLLTGDFDKVQYFGIKHKYSGDAVVTETLWVLCQYDSFGYDTSASISWDYTYECPSINSYDSLTLFWLSYGEKTGVYCEQDTTYVLVGDDLLHIVWKFTWGT